MVSFEFEGVPHVWISEKNAGCAHSFAPAKNFNAPKPVQLNSIDTLLWQQFSSAIDEHASTINVGLRTTSIVSYLIFIPLFILVVLSSVVPVFRELLGFEHTTYTGIILFIPMMCVYAIHVKINQKNQIADSNIENVCKSFRSKFEVKGFSIEYRTKWTMLCKPKHALPMRAIVFPPVPGYQESQTTDDVTSITNDNAGITNNYADITTNYDTGITTNYNTGITNYDTAGTNDGDLIDRKKWGLE